MAGLNPCNVFANAGAFGCRAREARQAVGFAVAARAATRFDLCIELVIAAPRKAATRLNECRRGSRNGLRGVDTSRWKRQGRLKSSGVCLGSGSVFRSGYVFRIGYVFRWRRTEECVRFHKTDGCVCVLTRSE